MSERISLSEEQRRLFLSPEALPNSVTVNSKTYTTEAPSAAGYKAAVWKVRDEYGRGRALKICIHQDYEDRSYLQELARTFRLEQHREFARFIDAGLAELPLGSSPPATYVCFVEEWVDGFTLEAFVEDSPHLATVSFFLSFVRGLGCALNILRKASLRHDDLHARNIMLVPPAPEALSQEWTFKVIDTGSLKPADSPITKPKDDHRNFVEHLVLIWNTIHARRVLTARDRRFLTEASRLLHSMLDDEPTIALREPAQIVEQFCLAYSRASSARADIPPNSLLAF